MSRACTTIPTTGRTTKLIPVVAGPALIVFTIALAPTRLVRAMIAQSRSSVASTAPMIPPAVSHSVACFPKPRLSFSPGASLYGLGFPVVVDAAFSEGKLAQRAAERLQFGQARNHRTRRSEDGPFPADALLDGDLVPIRLESRGYLLGPGAHGKIEQELDFVHAGEIRARLRQSVKALGIEVSPDGAFSPDEKYNHHANCNQSKRDNHESSHDTPSFPRTGRWMSHGRCYRTVGHS